jgi:AcrR family transcriptional regulator
MRSLDPELAHELRTVSGVVGQARRMLATVAPGEARAVVAQQEVAAGERRLSKERLRPGGAKAPVDQNDRFPGSLQLVLEPDTIDDGPFHRSLQSHCSELSGTVAAVSSRVKRPRRRYSSPLRADQAEQTRRKILDSALRLFSKGGYAGTTITAIAENAGVSPETIYGSFEGKRGLLEGAIEVAIDGAEDGAANQERWRAQVAAHPDADERLAMMVEYSCRVLARTRPLHRVIRGAADKEAFAAELGRRLLHERLAVQTDRIRTYLADALRPGLSVEEAGQRYCALASPELYYLLTAEFGWTAERHREWLAELLRTELLAT